VPDQGVGLVGIAYLRIAEKQALILDQADAVDADGVVIGLGLELVLLRGYVEIRLVAGRWHCWASIWIGYGENQVGCGESALL
jgi:hypothetical protein